MWPWHVSFDSETWIPGGPSHWLGVGPRGLAPEPADCSARNRFCLSQSASIQERDNSGRGVWRSETERDPGASRACQVLHWAALSGNNCLMCCAKSSRVAYDLGM